MKRILTVLFVLCTINVYSQFQTINGEVVIEAENYKSISGTWGTWEFKTEISGYEGSGYMQSTDQDPSLKFNAAITRLDYEIDFKDTGVYYVHLRTYAIDHGENGYFATFNGQQINYGGTHPVSGKIAFYIYVEKVNKWRWYTDGGGAEGRNLKVSFQVELAGKFIFSLYRRDTNSKVDKIWLTKHVSEPQNVATLDLPDPSVFLIQPSDLDRERLIYSTPVLLNAFPNPARHSFNIEFEIPASERVTLDMYNIHGKVITTLVNQEVSPGRHLRSFDIADLPDGLYILRWNAGTKVEMRRMAVIK